MPLFQAPGKQQTHHHGPLAGVSAGAMAALAGGGIILLACRRQLAEVATVAAVALMVLIPAAVVYALVWGFLRLRLHVRSPETLTRRPQVTAEVLDQTPAPQLAASQPVAELPAPPAQYITNNHFHGAEAVEAALQAMQEQQAREAITEWPGK